MPPRIFLFFSFSILRRREFTAAIKEAPRPRGTFLPSNAFFFRPSSLSLEFALMLANLGWRAGEGKYISVFFLFHLFYFLQSFLGVGGSGKENTYLFWIFCRSFSSTPAFSTVFLTSFILAFFGVAVFWVAVLLVGFGCGR